MQGTALQACVGRGGGWGVWAETNRAERHIFMPLPQSANLSFSSDFFSLLLFFFFITSLI